MIELLGQSPINSAITAGLKKFVSLLRKPVSEDFQAGRYPRTYTKNRGILIRRDDLTSMNIDRYEKNAFYFQFNPAVLNDVKETLYEIRGYSGLSYNDYVWGGGGERIVTFQLFLDNTPQSHTRAFRPSFYGSMLADELNDKAIAPMEGTGPLEIGYLEHGAWSPRRIDERGVLPQIEYLQSFLYPAPLEDKDGVSEMTPKFAEGGIVSGNQFRPPAIVVFALGPIYLEGVIKSAPVTYSLFDEDLTPIRATVDIELAVDETRALERAILHTSMKTPYTYEPREKL